MAVTDQNILSDVQSLLAEPLDGGATWPSGQWTPSEVIGYLNDAQQELLSETAIVLTRATIACIPHLLHHTLPEGWIATQRAVWKRYDGRRFILSRGDLWQLNNAYKDWKIEPGIPKLFTDADTPTLTIQLAPAPKVPGQLDILYLAIPTSFDGSGIVATIPDEVSVGLVWDTIQHQLTQEGRAKDPARAQVAEAKVQLVIEAVKLLLEGWEA